MDDTPANFLDEFKNEILKDKIGIIAMAIILAQAVLRLTEALSFDLVIPIIVRMLHGHTESVLFETPPKPFPYQPLLGSLIDFVFAIVVVFYLNRWIRGRPAKPPDQMEPEIEAPK